MRRRHSDRSHPRVLGLGSSDQDRSVRDRARRWDRSRDRVPGRYSPSNGPVHRGSRRSLMGQKIIIKSLKYQ